MPIQKDILKVKNIVIEQYGSKAWKKLSNIRRVAKERCCSPTCKDFNRYQGKWGFNKSKDFYLAALEPFLEGCKKYGVGCLSIDRIHNDKGYEEGNIRFVDMNANLRNRECVREVHVYTEKDITYVGTYPTVQMASKALGISNSNLSVAVDTRPAKGFIVVTRKL